MTADFTERGHADRWRSADILSAFIHGRQNVADPAADRISALRLMGSITRVKIRGEGKSLRTRDRAFLLAGGGLI